MPGAFFLLVPGVGMGAGSGAGADSADNPYWDILQATATVLAAVTDIPTISVRSIPFFLGSADSLPLCLVCPAQESGEQVVRQTFNRWVWWEYPVLVLLIHAGNRQVTSTLEDRLQLRHDVRQALFIPNLADSPTRVWDVECNPQAVVDARKALGTNYDVSGFLVRYRTAEQREA